MLTLYYYPLSTPCRSVLVLGKMLGIEFDLKSVNPLEKEQLKRDFIEVSDLVSIFCINIFNSFALLIFFIILDL